MHQHHEIQKEFYRGYVLEIFATKVNIRTHGDGVYIAHGDSLLDAHEKIDAWVDAE